MDRKQKILLVDDNDDNLSVLGNILIKYNYTLQLANNGMVALQMAIKKQPDIILLDISMPGMSGYEVCEKLKEDPITKHIPVIFLTAHTEKENIVKGFTLGAVDYITKPFQQEELVLRVKTHLDLKAANEALLQKNAQLEALNATKDKLFSIIGHDLRGAVGIIKGIVEIILDKPKRDVNEIYDFLKTQNEITQKTYFLLVNLLNWARQNMEQIQFQPKNVEICDLIKSSLSEIKFNAEQKNITIEVDCKGQYEVFVDVDMVKLIFRNLLVNAIKFTPKEGTVSVSLVKRQEKIEVKIIDNGIGISQENIQKLLCDSEFYTTSGTNNESGTGLGLKLVKDFIAMNKGELKIESELNKGSCFSVTLPV